MSSGSLLPELDLLIDQVVQLLTAAGHVCQRKQRQARQDRHGESIADLWRAETQQGAFACKASAGLGSRLSSALESLVAARLELEQIDL